MNEATVSVVIPTYNRAATVAEAIISALDQRDVPEEIIVINDGSSDQTPDVLAGFGDRIIAIHQQNAGVSGARNAGIRRASGAWIAFLDSDDVWYPERIAVLRRDVRAATDAGVHVANVDITSARYQRNMFDLTGFHFADNGTRHYGSGLEALLHYPFTSGVAVRRAWIDRSGAFDVSLSIFEDFDFLTRLCFLGPWLVSPLALANIRRLGDPRQSLSHLHVSDPLSAAAAMTRSFERLLAHPSLGPQEQDVIRRRLSHYRFEMAHALARAGQAQDARRILLRSAQDHPSFKGWLRALPALLLGEKGYQLIFGRSQQFHRSREDQASARPGATSIGSQGTDS